MTRTYVLLDNYNKGRYVFYTNGRFSDDGVLGKELMKFIGKNFLEVKEYLLKNGFRLLNENHTVDIISMLGIDYIYSVDINPDNDEVFDVLEYLTFSYKRGYLLVDEHDFYTSKRSSMTWKNFMISEGVV